VAVSAQSVNNLPLPDAAGLVDMRTGGRSSAGSFDYAGDELVTTWHRHDLHQIEFALRGVVEVETAAAHYLLPPQQAAWIPAAVEHRTTIRSAVRTISVFFDPELVPVPGERVRILAVPAVLREMMVYSGRWPIGRTGSDALADAFFLALGRLVSDSLDDEAPLGLPVSAEPVVAAAMEWTRDHLGTATVGDVARAVGVSQRSLRRRFETSVEMTWREYLLQARLLRAMALLAEPGPSVLEVAGAVGFGSLSAFDRAFRKRTGETPARYRRRRIQGP
jgi:AraC-like DNA-binding protein